jgi:hypothetical protein
MLFARQQSASQILPRWDDYPKLISGGGYYRTNLGLLCGTLLVTCEVVSWTPCRRVWLTPGFRIRIHLIRIRIQHLRLNIDPDPIRIQGFYDQNKNLKTFTAEKKLYFCCINSYQKLQFTYPKASIKDVQVTRSYPKPWLTQRDHISG